ncbi:T9SS type A sorting domain-containing protein [Pontibacter sp. HSC-14F20]|uniref:T9SS type A sorting domain-containing protein n=1 Tax=Pontibacter sp. HSC-14F20 TaxID=2864136 RepID=UPI002102485F|nr:T9SS type A sorting domain-containing protein [Pontibacter sp. HSC-14F20]
MKHFYSSNTTAALQPNAKAMGTAVSSKIILFLLLGFFLLLSGEGFAATFTATTQNKASGDWNSPSTWGVTAPAVGQPLIAGIHYPGADDDVIIRNSYIVTVPIDFIAHCKALSMDFAQGNVNPSIVINGTLTIATLTLNASNQSNQASMNVTVNGNLVVTTSATETGKLNFICGSASTVRYGLGVNVITPRSFTVGSNTPVTTPQPFQNLIIDGDIGTGTAAATLYTNVTVNGNLSLVNGGKLAIGNNTAVTPAIPYVLTLAEEAKIATTEDKDNYITGNVRAVRAIPAGGSGNFGMGAVIANNSTSSATITIVRTTGVNPINVEGNESAKRIYQVSGSTGANIIANLMFLNHEITQDISVYKMYNGDQASSLALSTDYTRSGNTFIKTGLGNGLYTIAGPPIVPLPVELISFKAQRDTKGVKLTWATASELDNKGFEVQVSSNARDFAAIGIVESKVGTTSLRQEYSFIDTKAVSGTRYYRLKQIDFDGTSSFSVVRSVALEGDNGTVSAYPNPFDDVVTVKLTGAEARQIRAVLSDTMGKVLLETVEETAGNSISVSIGGITTSGMYILNVYDKGKKSAFKLMKR